MLSASWMTVYHAFERVEIGQADAELDRSSSSPYRPADGSSCQGISRHRDSSGSQGKNDDSRG